MEESKSGEPPSSSSSKASLANVKREGSLANRARPLAQNVNTVTGARVDTSIGRLGSLRRDPLGIPGGASSAAASTGGATGGRGFAPGSKLKFTPKVPAKKIKAEGEGERPAAAPSDAGSKKPGFQRQPKRAGEGRGGSFAVPRARAGRGGRTGNDPPARVAFVGMSGTRQSNASMPTVKREMLADSKAAVKRAPSKQSTGEGISVVMGEVDEDTELFQKRLLQGEVEEEEEEWPPRVYHKLQPMTLPFSKRNRISTNAGAGHLIAEPNIPVFEDENDNDLLAQDDAVFLIQLPTRLPFRGSGNPSSAATSDASNGAVKAENGVKTEGDTAEGAAAGPKPDEGPIRAKENFDRTLEEMPSGVMGKMRIHQSGRVSFLVGGIPFEVTAGIPNSMSQEAVSINLEKKTLCKIGSIRRQLVVTPDFDTLLRDNLELHTLEDNTSAATI